MWTELEEWMLDHPVLGFFLRGLFNALMLLGVWGIIAVSKVSKGYPLPFGTGWVLLGLLLLVVFQFGVEASFPKRVAKAEAERRETPSGRQSASEGASQDFDGGDGD